MITEELLIDLAAKNYIRKASHKGDYWVDFAKSRIEYYSSKFQEFNIVIYSELNSPEHYYVIPFTVVKNLLRDEFMTNDKGSRKRWIARIEEHSLKISNTSLAIDIAQYYLGELSALTERRLPITVPRVENWNDVLENLMEFLTLKEHNDSFASQYFNAFANWYYFPNEDSFAPGKFLGYKNNTITKYHGLGDGHIAKGVLDKYFRAVSKTSPEFHTLMEKLNSYASSLNKKINSQTSTHGGGIYVPKEQYLNLKANYSSEILSTSQRDIESFVFENLIGFEGEKREKLVSYYERNPKLRAQAIYYHGTKCKICGFDFYERYGIHGLEYIEVHHLKALHSFIEASLINPITDMTVLCANCHRMIHRKKYFPLSIEELMELWQANNKE